MPDLVSDPPMQQSDPAEAPVRRYLNLDFPESHRLRPFVANRSSRTSLFATISSITAPPFLRRSATIACIAGPPIQSAGFGRTSLAGRRAGDWGAILNIRPAA